MFSFRSRSFAVQTDNGNFGELRNHGVIYAKNNDTTTRSFSFSFLCCQKEKNGEACKKSNEIFEINVRKKIITYNFQKHVVEIYLRHFQSKLLSDTANCYIRCFRKLWVPPPASEPVILVRCVVTFTTSTTIAVMLTGWR